MTDASGCGSDDEVCEECGNDLCSEGLTGCMDCVEADPQRDWMKGTTMSETIDYEKHCKDAIAALSAQMEKNRKLKEELGHVHARVNSMRDRLVLLGELAEIAADLVNAVAYGERVDEECNELSSCMTRCYEGGAVSQETAQRAGVYVGRFG